MAATEAQLKSFEGSTKEYMIEAYYLEADENHRLRKILLDFASRPEITAETRAWLSAAVKDKSQPIVRGLREDEMDEVRETLKAVSKLHDHVRKACDRPEGERLERIWYQQADSYCNQVSGRLQETQAVLGRDLEDLEEAR